ncbi:MAG TPA: TetR family transcriptional regulator [Solirubrobacteraceae bacterium]|nr:TetR family transcriptional regulator [Solirubrobacteraceae bacterium]
MSTLPRSPRVAAPDARARILAAARRLLAERSFAELTVDAVMAEAGLKRTIFYRHFRDLPQLAPDLLPDSDSPLVERVQRVQRERPQDAVHEMIAGLVAVFAEHGPLLRAIDAAASHDAAVAERLDTALVAPRRLIADLLAAAPHPPPDPAESARLMMAAQRAYLLDTFGDGRPRRDARRRATEALETVWERLLA